MIKPDPARVRELRDTLGVLPAKRQAMREAMLAAVDQAQTVDDLKAVLLALIEARS